MYFVDVLRVLRRRWHVLLVGLLIVGGAGVATIKLVPASYQASGEMLLLLPADASGKATPLNPFLNLQAGVSVVAALVAGKLTTDDANKEMVAEGFSGDYTVVQSPNIGALVEITVKDQSPARAVATRDELARRVIEQLRVIQTSLSVPDNQVIQVGLTNNTKTAVRLSGSKIRALAGVVGGLLVATLLVVFGVDRLFQRRPAEPRRSKPDRGRRGLRVRSAEPTGTPGQPEHPRLTRPPDPGPVQGAHAEANARAHHVQIALPPPAPAAARPAAEGSAVVRPAAEHTAGERNPNRLRPRRPEPLRVPNSRPDSRD